MIKSPQWKLLALADPKLTDEEYTLLKLGPMSLGQAFHLQAIKYKYQIRGMTL
jgi:hypothetical protein